MVNAANGVDDSYSYDAYGVLLQEDTTALRTRPGYVDQTSIATNLLYAGEHFDADTQQYYNRTRWYNPLNGRFDRVDPYAGNIQDPQSLHKYLYCHANPINAVDPLGLFSSSEMTFVVGMLAIMMSSHLFTSICLLKTNYEQEKLFEKYPELYNRQVNNSGVWVGYMGKISNSIISSRSQSRKGRIYSLEDPDINAGISSIGIGAGVGYGLSGGGGLIFVYNAKSLKDITDAWFVDIEFDVALIGSATSTAVGLAKLGIHIEDMISIIRLNQLYKLSEYAEDIEKMKDIAEISEGKPKAIIVDLQMGLQVFIGFSANNICIDDPSFK